MKTIETLVEDIYDLFRKDKPPISKQDVEKNIDVFVDELKSHLLDFLYTKRKPSTDLRLSLIGKKDRQIWYELNTKKKEEELPPEVRIKFLYGHLLESLLILFSTLAGHKVTNKQQELNVEGVLGHQDCLIDDVVVDCKSASAMGFKKFKNGTLVQDDPFGYIGQLSAYATAQGKKEAAFLAIDKQSGALALLKLHDMEMINAKERVKKIRSFSNKTTPPVNKCYDDIPEGSSGNRKLAIGCVYCPHKRNCWADSNGGQGLRLFKYARGNRFLSHVAKTPEVEEILAW
tara:strand:+ start:3468 stop:4331 length:864 start_codon:yes stop_codon:yes gene_type:complete